MADRAGAVTRIACFCFFVLVVAVNLSWLLYPASLPQLKDKALKARYQNDAGQTYLLEADAYAWMRYTRFILENGYPGNTKVDSVAYDTFMLAPYGAASAQQCFLFYSAAWLYRISRPLVQGLALETFLFYLPLFFAVIFFAALYYFCRYFFSRASGILAIFFIGSSPFFIERAASGKFDSDVLSLFFWLLVVWLLAVSLTVRRHRSKALLSVAAGFVVSLFVATWAGWWFVLPVALAFYFYYALRVRGQLAAIATSAAVFFLSSELFCLLLLRIEPFSQALADIIRNMGIAVTTSVPVWPNVYWFVSELLPLNASAMLRLSGHTIILCLYGFGILWAIVKHRNSDNHAATMLLLFWFLLVGGISLRAQRFIFFAMVPAGVFLGVTVADIAKRIMASLRAHRRSFCPWVVAIASVLAAAGFTQVFYGDAKLAAARILPLLTDDYYDMLQLLKQETPPESIINTWWDYGNWVKEVARRRVLFDPQSQNRPLAYWVAQALCTDKEETSVRILRMLNNSSDRLFYRIQNELNDDFKSIRALRDVLRAAPEEADSILKVYGISGPLRAEIREAVFEKKPAPAYLVLDRDMLRKISSISYLANWDFDKAYALRHKQEAAAGAGEARTAQEKREVLSQRWVFNPSLGRSNDRGRAVHFSNGIVFERDSLRSSIFSLRAKKFNTFKTTLFFDGERLRRRRYPDAELPGGALIVKAGERWGSIGFSDQALGVSMLSRLFFMQAKGLKHFELCFANEEAGIYAYEIKW